MNRMHLGIIIVSWNVCGLLDQCLTSIDSVLSDIKTTAITAKKASVIVIDNASQDGSVEMVRRKYPWVKLHSSSENLGYVKANNKAIRALLNESTHRPDAIWMLNPDTVVHATTITTLLKFFVLKPEAGIIGPKLLNPDGSLQESAFRFPGILQPIFDFGLLPQRFYFTVLNGRYRRHKYQSSKPFKVDHPLGAAMMVRTTAIDEVGLLDDEFFMYCEEIDWAWRMKKAGWESWLIPDAVLTHYGGASTSQVKPISTAYLWESRARLYCKHRNAITNRLVALMVKNHFTQKSPSSPEWENAFKRIKKAWLKNAHYVTKESCL